MKVWKVNKETFGQKVMDTLNNFNQNEMITINTVNEDNSKFKILITTKPSFYYKQAKILN